jgi:hypothetical protein
MAKESARKVWIAPELRRLGEIGDIAGQETPNAQGSGNSKS